MNTENLVIGICDDDLNDLEQIRQALCKCMKILEEEHVTVKGYQSSEKLYEESKQIKFHLLFWIWKCQEKMVLNWRNDCMY